ncbi:hypothetical protein DFH06DRAFT_1044012 [Mycena polygramma]|nr:hypothetical protein DFH06DRAFT_1044012 [Mycena polygramma]
MHNSAERPPDPACHPGTRESVLDTLRAWSRDDSPDARLLWLYGSAGMGKSAIAQTFAAEHQEDGSLGASFFFRRGDTGRGNWRGLFPTLAYQLSASFPELRDALWRAVGKDRLVLGQSMQHQFQKLFVVPFEQAPQLAVRPIIVVDGLDECEDRGVQVILLNLIIEGLRTGAFPVCLLLASRPEAHLREVLEAPANFDVCRHLELQPDTSAYADIRRYLCHEFFRIHQCRTSGGVPLDNGWPGGHAIEHLVEKSSGTFIYATTVVRYVDDEYSHPAERLDSILGLDSHSTAPLDTLYTQILSAVPNTSRSILRRVLHAVVEIHDWDPEEIDLALRLRAGTSRLILRGLHSLLSVPRVRTIGFRYEVKLLHASLADFLRDPARSLDLCIATAELDYALVCTMAMSLSGTPRDTVLFRAIATKFLSCIVNTPPAHQLLPIMYDIGVQDVAFGDGEDIPDILEWLKNCVPFPSDLVQDWEDLYYVSELQHSTESDNPSHDITGTEYDDVYTQVLSQNPQTLSVLRVASVWPGSPISSIAWTQTLYVLRLNWDALRPLCALKVDHGTLGKSLLCFLRDPRRAGILYSHPQEIYQFTALCCISRLRQRLIDRQFYQVERTGIWLDIISLCPPSELVLRELDQLNLAPLCAQLHTDREYHLHFHYQCLHHFNKIVDWLWRFPSPPLRAISFWEQQLAAVEACWQRLTDKDVERSEDLSSVF